ncbi:COG1470 family protein [Paracoccus broussonetiae]|nr:hypothetical protein [Paracoccus sp. CPCC 101403]
MDISGVDSALGDLIAAQLGLGRELIKALVAGGALLADGAKGLGLPKGECCCDIPEPCWMPRAVGEVKCRLATGAQGEVCLHVTNGDFRPHKYEVLAAGEDAGTVQIDPQDRSFTLGPKERRTVSVRVVMPKDDRNPDRRQSCCECDDLDLLIWVRGCADHYLRWIVCRDDKATKPCCHCVCVSDDPNYELHWYDHFHILRPCPSEAGRVGG